RQGRDRGVLAGDHVGQRHAHLHRLPVRLAGDGHPSSFGLDHIVVTRPVAVGPEAGDGAPHEARLPREKPARIESVSVECAAAKVVDDDIGLVEQRFDERAVALDAEIGGDALLVAVDAEIVGALASAIEWGAPGSGIVAGAGPLDFDDVSAKVAEHHGAKRAGEYSTEVEYPHSLEQLLFSCRHKAAMLSLNLK